MNFITLLKNSLKVFRVNLRRTILTSLGIIIGVAAVIVIISVGAGAQSLIFDQITSIGSNLIGILPGHSDEKGPPASVFGITVTTLKAEDALAIKKEIEDVEAVASYVRGVAAVQYQDRKTDATFVGTTQDYPQVESAQVELGNFFDSTQSSSVFKVVVLGWQVGQDLFGNDNPVGERVRIKRESFRVIGVMTKRGTEGFQNQDELAFMPLPAAQKLLLGINHVSMIRAKVREGADPAPVIVQIRSLLRERHNLKASQDDDFTVRSAVQALDVLRQVTNALRAFLAAIAAISLIVGGVGIMNIMLVSINERTREIGLRKALGATNGDIQNQFLTESLILTIAGGVIGIIAGAVISGLIALAAWSQGLAWNYQVSLASIILAVGVAGLVGIVFGWYPARRAANLEPIEALRYE